MSPQLQPHSVTPSIDLYLLMFFLSVSNKIQDSCWVYGWLGEGVEEKKGALKVWQREIFFSRNKEKRSDFAWRSRMSCKGKKGFRAKKR